MVTYVGYQWIFVFITDADNSAANLLEEDSDDPSERGNLCLKILLNIRIT